MARKKPMTIGLLGTGKASVKTTSALISDLVTDASEVTVIVPLTKAMFTPSIEALLEWAHDEGYKYEAVLDDTSADDKELSDFIDAAQKTYKMARPEVKMVNLLARTDEGKLLMLWDDEDEACMSALERAVENDVLALDLTNGLDVLQFDDPAGESDEEAPRAAAKDDDEDDDTPERTVAASDDDPAAEFAPADDLDSLGVRVLRNMAEEELGLTRRKVGQMSKPDCIDALRKHRGGGQQAAAAVEDDEPGDEAQQDAPRRQRAEEDERPVSELQLDADDEPVEAQGTTVVSNVSLDPFWARQRALEIAAGVEESVDKTLARAEAYADFLIGK